MVFWNTYRYCGTLLECWIPQGQFSPNTHNKYSIICSGGEIWGEFCEFQVWSIFWSPRLSLTAFLWIPMSAVPKKTLKLDHSLTHLTAPSLRAPMSTVTRYCRYVLYAVLYWAVWLIPIPVAGLYPLQSYQRSISQMAHELIMSS